jgi:hypothetical protein
VLKIQRFVIVLTIFNLALLVFFISKANSVEAQSIAPVIRTQRLELVDDNGIVRASLSIEKDPDTVLLRMRDPKGLVRLKLGADEKGSGLMLANDTQQPGILIIAKDTGSSLKLTNRDGKEQLITP